MARVCEEWFPLGSYPKQMQVGFHMHDYLKEQLDILMKNVLNDWDFTIIISGSGEVRVGKSVLAMQIGCYWAYQLQKKYKVDVPWSLYNFVWLWTDLISRGHALGNKHPYSPFIYDEAGETLDTGKSQTKEAHAVIDYLRECGQYNFLNILVAPEFFKYPSSIAINRTKFLIDVTYTADKNGMFTRGSLRFFSPRKKKELYLKGKKFLDYYCVAPNFIGDFHNIYTVDKEQYKKEKNDAFAKRENRAAERVSRHLIQRNAAFYLLNQKYGMPCTEISKQLGELTGLNLSHDIISLGIKSLRPD